MNVLDILRLEYPGDIAWERFLRSCGYQDAKKTNNSHVDEEIVIAAASVTGSEDRALEWLQKGMPELGGKSALQVIKSEVEGRKIVRSLLMRLH